MVYDYPEAGQSCGWLFYEGLSLTRNWPWLSHMDTRAQILWSLDLHKICNFFPDCWISDERGAVLHMPNVPFLPCACQRSLPPGWNSLLPPVMGCTCGQHDCVKIKGGLVSDIRPHHIRRFSDIAGILKQPDIILRYEIKPAYCLAKIFAHIRNCMF